MNYQVLVLDLDGTLTNSDKVITKKTYDAIMTIQEKGVKVVLASGRPTYGIMPLAKELKLAQYGGYILSFNGGKVINCKDETILFEKTLPESELHRVFDLAKKYEVNILSYEDDLIITETAADPYVRLEAKINHLNIKQVVHLNEYIYFPVVKCIMLGDGERMAEIEPNVRKELGELFNVYRSEPFFLEIMPEGIDKAKSLERLLANLNLGPEVMVACGDGYNDISMIQYAGLGVAMENANDTVKKVADFITKSNDEDGIFYVIEKYFL